MNPMVNAIQNLIPISAFNKGEAGRIFSAVKKTGQPKLVLRHNAPECVLIAPDDFTAMVEELEDLRDYKMAVERLAASSPDQAVDWSELLQKIGVSQADLDAMGDVELA